MSILAYFSHAGNNTLSNIHRITRKSSVICGLNCRSWMLFKEKKPHPQLDGVKGKSKNMLKIIVAYLELNHDQMPHKATQLNHLVKLHHFALSYTILD